MVGRQEIRDKQTLVLLCHLKISDEDLSFRKGVIVILNRIGKKTSFFISL